MREIVSVADYLDLGAILEGRFMHIAPLRDAHFGEAGATRESPIPNLRISKYENNKMLTEINIYDYLDNKHSYLLDSRNHKIYTEYTPEGKGIVEAEGAFIQRFTSTYQAPEKKGRILSLPEAV